MGAAVHCSEAWFYSLTRQKTFVGGTCTLPSAVLVVHLFYETVCILVTAE